VPTALQVGSCLARPDAGLRRERSRKDADIASAISILDYFPDGLNSAKPKQAAFT
jgi:hypothetical protein